MNEKSVAKIQVLLSQINESMLAALDKKDEKTSLY
jgi:hypothetical protein